MTDEQIKETASAANSGTVDSLVQFRSLRWWLPEAMNRLLFPAWICSTWRRNEVAHYIRDARSRRINIGLCKLAIKSRRAPKKLNAPDQARLQPSPEADCSPSPWRRMAPEEYARDFASFPPHRATVEMAVKGEPASAEVAVFIASANATGESRAIARTLDPIVGNLDSGETL